MPEPISLASPLPIVGAVSVILEKILAKQQTFPTGVFYILYIELGEGAVLLYCMGLFSNRTPLITHHPSDPLA